MNAPDGWTAVVDLIERVMGDEDLLPSVIAGVRATVPQVAVLPPSDIAGHTRALLTAATRALAARRGPTEAELAFVEELGVTRARQGIAIEAVLGAIHIAERAIWARAREVARSEDVSADRLLDARELYDDWADAVRGRLITSHRITRAGMEPLPGARDAAIMRRLLQGGSAAALAVAEAGLPAGGGLWVLVARPDARWEKALREQPPVVCAVVDDLFVAVLARAPGARAGAGPAHGTVVNGGAAGLAGVAGPGGIAGPGGVAGPVGAAGIAGPADADKLSPVHRLAIAALAAAEATGGTGVVHIADVAWVAALTERADLAAVLLDRHRRAWTTLGPNAEPVAHAVLAFLESDRDVTVAGARLFVHPNTVRNRVRRFTELTGIDPSGTFGATNAWWLCRTWLREAT